MPIAGPPDTAKLGLLAQAIVRLGHALPLDHPGPWGTLIDHLEPLLRRPDMVNDPRRLVRILAPRRPGRRFFNIPYVPVAFSAPPRRAAPGPKQSGRWRSCSWPSFTSTDRLDRPLASWKR